MNTRRQHSLLTTSTNPPLKRFTLLNKLDEEVMVDGKSYMLATNLYPGTTFPEGHRLISKFEFDYFPQLTFDLDGTQVTKRVLMPKGSGSIYVHYKNHSKKPVTIRLLPLISFRWKDSIRKAGDGFLVDELPDGVRIISEMNLPRLYLKLSQMYSTSPESHWYYDFIYLHDKEIYGEDREDLYNIGFWETEIEPEKGLTFAASTRDLAEFDYEDIEAHYIEAREKIRTSSGLPRKYVHLCDAASNHLAKTQAIRSLAILDGFPYGGVSVQESLISMHGISSASEKPNYETEFLYDIVSNEMGGALPSGMNESTAQINYDDPTISLYLAVAVKRCAERENNGDCLKRYLPFLEDVVENILQNHLGGSRLKGTSLIDVSSGMAETMKWSVANAAVNSLWYNILRVVDEAKSSAESFAAYSEITAEIESVFFDSFYESDGRFKGSGDGNELAADMALPLVLPYSPLNERQREIIFGQLAKRLIDSLNNPSLHFRKSHACNLTAIYLVEAGNSLPGFEGEKTRLKEILSEMLTFQSFTNSTNGIPKCGVVLGENSREDISSSVVVGEAIRVIKKLKLK